MLVAACWFRDSVTLTAPSCRQPPVRATLAGLAAEGTATLESDRSAAASPLSGRQGSTLCLSALTHFDKLHRSTKR